MDYIMIRAYGQYTERPSRDINDDIQTAHEDKAPGNAIYKTFDGEWVTIEALKRVDRVLVDRLASRIQRRDNPPITRTII